jgi:hypothetical protein
VDVMMAEPLALPDAPLELADLGEAIRAWGQRVQQAALAPAGRTPRKVETTFGSVRLAPLRRRCRGCGWHFQPDDAVLGPALGTGHGPRPCAN